MEHPYERPLVADLAQRLREPRRFLQVVAGPRQVGKTTLVAQALAHVGAPRVYESADGPLLEDLSWIEGQWMRARRLAADAGRAGAILALDEVQKVRGWSETVKRLWDEDSRANLDLRVILLGSSALLVQQGLVESLAGRFEVSRAGHWTYPEMDEAFGWDWDRYVYFGGYPGAAPLIESEARWTRYILDSLIETTVARDILLMARVDKPALLRRLFALACEYSGQILSYQKMLGQLQDAGNAATLAHYLDLLAGAGLVAGVRKYSGERVRQRASSPKLQVLNTALVSAASGRGFRETREDPAAWGRRVESAVGAHLVGGAEAYGIEVYYWRERGEEVDFVLRKGARVTAIEVRSGLRTRPASGLAAFERAFGPCRPLRIGSGGVPFEEFVSAPLDSWL